MKLRKKLFLQRCWAIAIRDTYSPIFDKSQFFSLLTIPIFLLLSFLAGDLDNDLSQLEKSGIAILLSFPIWGLLNIVLSPFRAWKEEKEVGSWSGDDKFNYNEPLLVCVYHFQPKDDGSFKKIKIKEAPPNTLCRFKLECVGGIGEASLNVHEKNSCLWGMFDRSNQRIGVRITEERETKLIFKCPPNSDQTTVRVYLLSWEQ